MDNRAITQEREIDLRDLLFQILRQWRKLLIAALVGLVLIGGYRMVSEIAKDPVSPLTQEETDEKQSTLASNQSTLASYQAELPQKEQQLEDLKKTKENYDDTLKKTAKIKPVTPELITGLIELDDNIAETQSQITSTEQRIETLKNEITRLQNDNTALQASLDERISDFRPKNIVVGAILGIILGIIVFAGCVCVRVVLGDKLQTRGEAEDMTRLMTLGTHYTALEREKKTGKVDRWILRHLGGKDEFPEETQYEITASKLQLLAEQDRRIVVTGPVDREQIDRVCAGIGRFWKGGQPLLALDNPMKDASALRELENSAVLLVIGIKQSGRMETAESLQFLRAGDIPVLGTFLV